MLYRLVAACFLLIAMTLGSTSAHAAASDWVASAESKARLVTATDATGDQTSLRFGLEIALEAGWKTYWRTPGEGGFPPRLEWNGSDNLAKAELHYPAPTRFQILGIDSVGYTKHVIYPLTITPERVGEAVTANLTLDYLTCSDVCIPQHAKLSLTVPAGPASPSAEAFAIDQARGQLPGPAIPGFQITAATVSPGDGNRWWLEVETDAPLQQPDLFAESAGDAFAFGAPMRLGPTKVRLPVLYAQTQPSALAGETLTLTLTDGARALEQQAAVSAGAANAGTTLTGWLLILLTALAGGLILNLMPCVLPVLSIKLMGLVQHGGGERGKARASFLATAAGILLSFAALAGGAIALKLGGTAVGWGMQFQEPLFIAFMTLICVLFAANLWGWFELPMPAAFGRLGEGQAGAFATGVFATLLATPCSAPFVGTAVAFALGHGWVETLAIFLAMGLGLALPYLAVALFPGIATSLPRPGRWMLTLRVILGFALAATAAWLVSIILALSGMIAAVALAALCGVLLLWLWQAAASWRLPGAVALILAAMVLPTLLPSPNPASRADTAGIWQPFDQAQLAGYVAEGKTVLVDVTADWCITCQANKAAVLNRGAVAEKLTSKQVLALKADWTRPNPAIQAYLASFGRYGIPFNAVYGPKAPGGIALPELLTEGAVLSAIESAGR
jgi:suppressor for copper-sensitivity B